MSAIDVPVISALNALSLQPASAATPASAANPASAENPIPRTMAPPQQYVQTGERAPKLSAVPSRQEVPNSGSNPGKFIPAANSSKS